VDGPARNNADRGGVGDGGPLAAAVDLRRGRGSGDGVRHAAGDRGPPVPVRSGSAPRPAGRRPPGRDRGDPAGRPEERIRFLLRLTRPEGDFSPTAAIAAEGVTVELDTAGVIDVAAERRRMEKDLAAARKEAEQARTKLGNAGFTAKAPPAVVDSTRQRLAAAEQDIARIIDRLALLPAAG